MFNKADLSQLEDFGIGHAQNNDWITGCTVVYAHGGATCSVDVRGGGPATRETDLLKPENMVQKVNAVCLSGGSAFGLEATCGVMECLQEQHIGFQAGPTVVPIVPGACIFDLPIGESKWPNKQMGYEACQHAIEAQRLNFSTVEQGNVGAGTGATVGKLGDPTRQMKSGFGFSCLHYGELAVAAVVVVNAKGNVMSADNTPLAGYIDNAGNVSNPIDSVIEFAKVANPFSDTNAGSISNTTIGCVLANAKLDKAQCLKVSQMTHDAYARAIKPVHTLGDGDTIFTLASGRTQADTDLVGVIATEAMEEAIRNAVLSAKSLGGFTGLAK